MNSVKGSFELRGVHVLWSMIAFFAAIIAINVAFTIAAIDTFPGEDVRRSYLQGLQYNQTLAERRAESALGWRAIVSFEPDAAQPTLIVQLADSSGAPIVAKLEGVLRRPVDARFDQTLQFERQADGSYRAALSALAPGAWELRAQAVQQDQHFSIERRLTWQPSRQR